MKNLIIIGAGTAGIMMANHLHHHLKQSGWQISILMKEKNIITNLVIFFSLLIFILLKIL